jgi:hypothetical protein
MKTRHFLLSVWLGIFSLAAGAEQNEFLDVEKITINVINMHFTAGATDVPYSVIRKICIGSQAYLLLLGSRDGPILGLSASYKDGKPEQCKFLPDGTAKSVK